MAKKVVVRHFHEGNDADHGTRGSADYATRASIVDLTTGVHLADEWAYCSPKDPPSRAKGRFIAVARLKGRNPDLFAECVNAGRFNG